MYSMNQDRAPQPDNKDADREATKRRVEWLAWALQLVVGLLAGCVKGSHNEIALFL
jgi:hypothetical protein